MKDIVICTLDDRNASPDPDRAIQVTVAADGTIHFVVDFKQPGCFAGAFMPGKPGEPAGVVAYVYPVNAAALTEETECVTCLDTYDAQHQADENNA